MMLKQYKKWQRNKRVKKIKEGDGHWIKPFRFWQLFTRTIFHIHLNDQEGVRRKYSVSVEFFDEKEQAKLYIDDRHTATSDVPASFPVPDGYIELDMTMYGLKRMHYVSGEAEQMLEPDRRSAEGLRKRFHWRFPMISKWVGWIAVFTLLVSLVLGIPQIIEVITYMDFIREHVGTFTSPIQLPQSLNITLLILSAIAALERALTLKNHWLIDMETNSFEDF